MKQLFLILISFCCAHIVAQKPVSFRFSQRNDLKDIHIYDIIEDRKGFVWLGGEKALYRYDGSEFKKYINSERKGLSVFSLSVDNEDNIWCSNINGQIFQMKNDSLHLRYNIPKEFNIKERLYPSYVLNNHLYIQGYDILGTINLTTQKKVNHIKDYISTGFLMTKDTLFFAGNRRNKYFAIYYATKDKPNPQLYNKITFNSKDYKKGIIYKHKNKLRVIFADEQIPNYEVTTKKVTPLSNKQLVKERLNSVHSITSSNHWVSSQKGAYLISGDNQKIQDAIFQGDGVSKVFKDQQENLWVTLLGKGVSVIPNYRLKQIPISAEYGRITCGTPINDQLLAFGTNHGYLLIYDQKDKTIKANPIYKSHLIEKLFYHQKENNIIILSNSGNARIFSLEKNKLSNQSLGISSTKSVSKIDENLIFTSSNRAQYVIDLTTFKVIKNNFPSGRTYASLYDQSKKELYISYLDKTIKIDSLEKKIILTADTDRKERLLIRKFTQLDNGDIYVGTFKHGVFKVEGDKLIHQFSTKNGLLNNEITALTNDNENLWVGTEESIQKINLTTKEISKITHLDGIESFKLTSLINSKDFTYFTTNIGLFYFEPSTIFKPIQNTKPYFTSISINGEDMPLAKSYILKPNQTNIQFKFNTNGFQFDKTYQYSYQLKGYHDDWQTLSKGVQEVQFNSLPKGNYEFLLRNKNYDQIDEAEPIKIKVKNYFYKQWWFYLILGLTIAAMIITYYRNLISRQQAQQQIVLEQQSYETEKIALKLENLRSQMNPHFVFNALNSIQDYIINNQKNLAGDYLGKFAHLIRLYLDQTRKKTISLEEEIDTLNRYLELEQLRFEDLLDYSITYENIAIEEEFIPTMLIQPYVENSIKHGFLHKKNKGILEINFSIDDNNEFITCEITDNGIGRVKAKEIQEKRRKYESFSTKAITDRVQLLNHQLSKEKQIHVETIDLKENGQAKGTKVVLTIPKNNNQLQKA